MNDVKIKKTGTEKKYGEATRCTKEGKGRYDLIPGDIICDVIEYTNRVRTRYVESLVDEITSCLFNNKYIEAISHMIDYVYYDEKNDGDDLTPSFMKMLQDLAYHFEEGANIYGEHNCEKGIPLWSFKDSATRHFAQYVLGETDEPHAISSIWNMIMAAWTIKHHPERCIITNKE